MGNIIRHSLLNFHSSFFINYVGMSDWSDLVRVVCFACHIKIWETIYLQKLWSYLAITSILTLPCLSALCWNWVSGYYFVPIDCGRIQQARQSDGEAKICIFNNKICHLKLSSEISHIFVFGLS